MTEYYSKPEFHTMPETYYAGKIIPAADFYYAIRRKHDGSLVFRAANMRKAEQLLSRLNAVQAEAT